MIKHWQSWLGFGICVLAIGCKQRREPPSDERTRTVSSRAVAGQPTSQQSSRYATDNSFPQVREPHVRKDSEVTELLTDATSAFRAGLAVDDYAVYLLTDEVAHRIVPGSAPERTPIAHGVGAAVTRTDYVYWSNGAVWRVPIAGGRAHRVTPLPLEPQYFMAAGNDFAWLSMQNRERFVIQTYDDRTVRSLVSVEGRIETATMSAGRVYFVARSDAMSWRIGSVPVRGGEPTYSALKIGQTPSKLSVEGDVYYYDVKSNELRELSSDLARERTLTHDFICSPLTVSVRIYCPNMSGMFELARHQGAKLMPLFPSRTRISAVAASSKFLVWLTDAGPDRLSLKMIRLELDE